MVWGTLFGVGKGNLKIILHGWRVHAVPAFRVNSGVFYGCSLLSSALRWNRKQPLAFSPKNSKVFFSCISIWWRRSGAEVSWMCLLPPSVPHCNLMPLSSTAYKTELQKRVLVESKLAVPVEAIRDLGVSQQALRLFGVWAELLHCLTCHWAPTAVLSDVLWEPVHGDGRVQCFVDHNPGSNAVASLAVREPDSPSQVIQEDEWIVLGLTQKWKRKRIWNEHWWCLYHHLLSHQLLLPCGTSESGVNQCKSRTAGIFIASFHRIIWFSP